jgi:catechol 2,3-dioxygenase-like lactoylglutathione lyase family enzyme
MGVVADAGFPRRDPANLDQAIAEVTAAGGRLVERGQQESGRPHARVADPDGCVVELS